MIRRKLIFVALLVSSLLTPAFVAAAADDPPILRPSPDKIELEGVTGEDTLTATFYLLTGAQEVKSVNLLASDLISENGARITGSEYQITPNSFASIPAYNGKPVTLTIANIRSAGVYTGTIAVMFEGVGPDQRPQLSVKVIAGGEPSFALAKDSTQVSITANRPAISLFPALTEPAVIHLRQTGVVSATLVGMAEMGPAAGSGSKPIAQEALIVSPTVPMTLSQDIWQAISISVDASALSAGHYGATLVLTPDLGSDLEVPVDVRLRDAWIWPLLCLLLGVLLSLVVAAYTTVGQGRVRAYAQIDSLRARLDAREGLPIDRVEEWRETLDDLEVRVDKESPANVQPELDALAERIKKGEATYRDIRKQLDDWEQTVSGWKFAGSPDVRKIAASPWITGLATRVKLLKAELMAGGFARGEMKAKAETLGAEVMLAGELVKAVPAALADSDTTPEQAGQIRESIAAGPASDEELESVIRWLREKGFMKEEEPTVVIESYAAVRDAVTGEVGVKPSTRGIGARLKDAWAWLSEPRRRWRFVGYLLGLLFLAGLLVAGMMALYVNKDTFGANRLVDYLGLFLWGLGADASRRKLQDLQGVTDYLRERLSPSQAA